MLDRFWKQRKATLVSGPVSGNKMSKTWMNPAWRTFKVPTSYALKPRDN